MRPVLALAVVAAIALAGAGCGHEIGDSCVSSTDCSTNGTRICDLQSTGGYCTIVGCDYGTCPSEAACIRFFSNSFANKPCNAQTEDCVGTSCPSGKTATNDCNLDELCAIDDHCVTRASEIRFCMRTCNSDSDCRDGYECRDAPKMIAHGGEPVPPTGQRLGDSPQKFCAEAPAPSTMPDAGAPDASALASPLP